MNKPDPGSAESAHLRAAHAALDERPAPRVRAAVMAAALEHLNVPQRPARPAPRFAWLHAHPWQAAFATMVVSAVAVGVVVDLRKETGAPATVVALNTPAEAPARVAPRPAIPDASVPTAAAEAPRPTAAAAAPAPRQAPVSPPVLPPLADAAPAPFPAAGASTARMAAAPAAAPAAEPMAAAPRAQVAEAPAANSASRMSARSESVADSANATAAPAYRSTPERWMARIIELRGQHANAQADDELARYRAAYPLKEIPPAAR